MKRSRLEQYWREYAVQIIVLLLGLIIMMAAWWGLNEDEGRAFSIVSGIGVSFISSSLISFASIRFIRRQDELLAMCRKWGIKEIYELRSQANDSIHVHQQHAKKQIDIIAFGLSSWIQSRDELIKSLLRRGVSIRILTLHPANRYLAVRDKAEGKKSGDTRKTIESLADFVKRNKSLGSIEIKYHENLPLDFYFRVDSHVFVGPYLFGKSGQQTITFEFEKGATGFEYYTSYFEKLWKGESQPSLSFRNYP